MNNSTVTNVPTNVNGTCNGTNGMNGAAAKSEAEDTPYTPYEEAIIKLNSLQSNAATIQKLRDRRDSIQAENVPQTVRCLQTLGISLQDIDKLQVIHVSGTKGKGSTCAFVESILRHYGYTTGLYTSPHLVSARERIRINGKPIDEHAFARYFFDVYDTLFEADASHMPPYFKFLTLLAFRIFTQMQVDVAIIEVGIGGEYDCTNCIENPVVCGITTLDIDHTSLLGSTLPQIAWHKAGILKTHSVAFYTPTAQEAEDVIRQRATDKQCELFSVPRFEDFDWKGHKLCAGICGKHQTLNIAMALQLTARWLERTKSKHAIESFVSGKGFPVPIEMIKGIENCRWPGRSHTVETERAKYFLDGAHTPKSMEVCAEWLSGELQKEPTDCKRVLVFQCTADRSPSSLLPYLKDLNFSEALFCPTLVSLTQVKKSDLTNFNASTEQQKQRAEECRVIWKKLTGKESFVFPCISSAIAHLSQNHSDPSSNHLLVCVTGSLHLVGGVLSIISPNVD
ncbi:hypothetical protein WR25_02211 [Diploscapter pachys]|uniref:Folylpolyglutamate synthase n=1 Tax=Diploscapter pachys TaxID=2018661 RepID=A0A2A2J9K4_9BILA|nr:hypothetical protein WR25_02211 [Diploscapter pachys]